MEFLPDDRHPGTLRQLNNDGGAWARCGHGVFATINDNGRDKAALIPGGQHLAAPLVDQAGGDLVLPSHVGHHGAR